MSTTEITIDICGALDPEKLKNVLEQAFEADPGPDYSLPRAWPRMPLRFERPEGWSPYGDRFG